MTVPLTMEEIETAVFSAAEEADVFHDRRWCRGGDSITLHISFLATVDHKCPPSLSTKRSYGRGLDTVTVCHSHIFNPTTTDTYNAASDDFDHLLFEFGLELDEDVRRSLKQEPNARAHP